MIKSSQIKNYIHNNKNNPYSEIHEVRTYGLKYAKLFNPRSAGASPHTPTLRGFYKGIMATWQYIIYLQKL